MKRKKKTSVSSPPLKKARALDAEEGPMHKNILINILKLYFV